MCAASRSSTRPRTRSAASWATRSSCWWSATACCASRTRIQRSRSTTRTSSSRIDTAPEHDPEKWEPVFRKHALGLDPRDHAQMQKRAGRLNLHRCGVAFLELRLRCLGHHELGTCELGEVPALTDQLVEVAAFDDAAAREHED